MGCDHRSKPSNSKPRSNHLLLEVARSESGLLIQAARSESGLLIHVAIEVMRSQQRRGHGGVRGERRNGAIEAARPGWREERRTIEGGGDGGDAVRAADEHFEAQQLREAFQANDVVPREVDTVELVLQTPPCYGSEC